MPNTRYENFVLENKLKDQLSTKLEMLDYVTVDNGLTAEAGMVKKIHVYSATGAAQDVAEGYGNTQSIEMSYAEKAYTVGTTQARFVYTDEDMMTDPFLVDGGVQKLAESLTNALSAKVNDEFWEATQFVPYTKGTDAVGFTQFVDAIALFNIERDDEESIFALVNPKMVATLRKNLKDDLKYSEGFVRTGYIGTVAGVPVITDKLVAADSIILATKAAVTYFRKTDVQTEQGRDENTRTNSLYARQVGVVAFTDASKCAIIAPYATAPTITTASIVAGTDVSIAGGCVSGAKIDVYNGDTLLGAAAVSGTSWSYTIATCTTGDTIKVVQRGVKGFAPTASAGKTVVAE